MGEMAMGKVKRDAELYLLEAYFSGMFLIEIQKIQPILCANLSKVGWKLHVKIQINLQSRKITPNNHKKHEIHHSFNISKSKKQVKNR